MFHYRNSTQEYSFVNLCYNCSPHRAIYVICFAYLYVPEMLNIHEKIPDLLIYFYLYSSLQIVNYSESIDPAPRKNVLFCPGGRRKYSPWNTCIFLSSPKYMKNICCYHFSSQHDAFLFFLTFLTLENNLKSLR